MLCFRPQVTMVVESTRMKQAESLGCDLLVVQSCVCSSPTGGTCRLHLHFSPEYEEKQQHNPEGHNPKYLQPRKPLSFRILFRNPERKPHLEGGIILRSVLNRIYLPRNRHQKAGFCHHRNELWSFTKGGNFLDQLRDYFPLKRQTFAPCHVLIGYFATAPH